MFIFLVCDNFNIWCFFNLIKPDEVGKPIANKTSQQFWHYIEFSSLYLTLIDRKPASFIIIIWRVTLPFLRFILLFSFIRNCWIIIIQNHIICALYSLIVFKFVVIIIITIIIDVCIWVVFIVYNIYFSIINTWIKY